MDIASLLPVCLDTGHAQFGLGLIQDFQYYKTLHLERIQAQCILLLFISVDWMNKLLTLCKL